MPLVVRMCYRDGTIPGSGVFDLGPSAGFRFPAVGESFEWPGPELRKIPSTGPLEAHFEDRYLLAEGIHAHSGRISESSEFHDFVGHCSRYYYTDWLVLSVADSDVVHDKHRVTGKCRVKRGTVVYRGDFAGAAAYLRAHWPADAGPEPRWHDETVRYPRSTPPIADATVPLTHYAQAHIVLGIRHQQQRAS